MKTFKKKCGTFVLDPPLLWNFHSRGCLFNSGRHPLEKICTSKIMLYYTVMPIWLVAPGKKGPRGTTTPLSRKFPPSGPSSPRNFHCPPLADMDIFWNYTILWMQTYGVTSMRSTLIWNFHFSMYPWGTTPSNVLTGSTLARRGYLFKALGRYMKG